MRITKLERFAELMQAELPSAVVEASGMISRQERQFLFGYTSRHYSGTGVIVDAGIFLGASTITFGEAIRANVKAAEIVSKFPKPIKSYERAAFREGMKRTFEKNAIMGEFEEGASFAEVVRTRIAPVSDLVDLRIGDICSSHWTGEPIEILFLDVLKNKAIHRFVLDTFFSHLVPGAIVIQQDYFIESQPFIKTAQECLGQYFDYVGQIRSTAIFQLKSPIPPNAISAAHHSSLDRQLEYLDAARDRCADPDRRILVELSKVFALRSLDRARASATLDGIISRTPDNAHWRIHHASDRARAALGRPRTREQGGWRPMRQRIPEPNLEKS